jgi:IPT/TIG domain
VRGGSLAVHRGPRRHSVARSALVGLLVTGAGVLAPIALATVASTPAAAESLTPLVTGLSGGPQAMTTNSSADVFIGQSTGVLDAWSESSTTLYGKTVPADTLTSIATESGSYTGLTWHDGDLWISTTSGSSGIVQVLSPTSGTFFGVSVPADTATTIITDDNSDNISPAQVAFDSAGDLFVATSSNFAGDGSVDVDPVASGTLYGQSVTVNTLHALVTGLNQPDGVAVDSTNNLYYGDDSLDNVSVLPESTGTIFGTPVTADQPTELYAGFVGLESYDGFSSGPLAFDGSGNLYATNLDSGVVVLSNSSGTLFGTSVSADTPTALNLDTDALDIAFNSAGNLAILEDYDNAVVEATTPTASITGVTYSGSLDNPTVTVNGTGFGTEPTGSSPGCSASGKDFPYSEFVVNDLSQGWQAGIAGDCVGLNVTSYSSTQVVATFGSWYTDEEVADGNQIHPGDNIIVGLAGSYTTETVPEVSSVTPSSGPATGATTVTINGSGFTGATAVDFGSNAASGFTVETDSSITATAPAGTVGTVDVTVTTPVGTSQTSSADRYTYYAAISATYTCAVPGQNNWSFPVAIGESPTPPSSQDAGATFQEALAAQVTVPSGLVENWQEDGDTSFTLESQSATENGLSSPDGSASGAVDPSAETASAGDVPQTFTPDPSTAITYQTSYDPVTWQTGPGTGIVYLTPGDLDFALTLVSSESSTTISIQCTPPANVGNLGTTTVDPAPAAATVQVAPSSPPVQSDVTAGSDDGWTFTVANTSQTTVTGLQTQITISDGSTPPSFDTTAIAASGTKGCTATSAGVLTCTENTLAAGASDTVNVLVETTGLSQGTAVTGSAAVTSTNAASATDSLGQFSVVVVNNGVDAVGTPGIPVYSSTEPLFQTGGDVKLTLPRTKIPDNGPMASGVHPEAGGGTVKPPVVGLTLESLPASDEPELCPPADGGCPGDVVEVEGNFSSYVSEAHPVTALIQVYFGSVVPANLSMYMLEFSGQVAELPKCVKTAGDYNTPCVKGKQKTIGTSGALSLQATVLFTANDPGFTFR